MLDEPPPATVHRAGLEERRRVSLLERVDSMPTGTGERIGKVSHLHLDLEDARATSLQRLCSRRGAALAGLEVLQHRVAHWHPRRVSTVIQSLITLGTEAKVSEVPARHAIQVIRYQRELTKHLSNP